MGYTVAMKKTNAPVKQGDSMVFKFRFQPLILAVIIAGLILCAACFSLTSWQFVGFLQGDISSPYDWIKFVLLYFVSIFLGVILVSMLAYSRYIVTPKELVLQFGVIKSKYEIRKIFSARIFKKSNKLTVYFDDFKTKYMIVVVREEWYEDFVEALREKNERIEFDFVSAEEEEDWKNNQKKK